VQEAKVDHHRTVGVETYYEHPINIESQDGDTVTFSVTQYWKADGALSWLMTFYNQSSTDGWVCTKTSSFMPETTTESYTANCNEAGVASVALFLHDGSFQDSSNNADSVIPWTICEASKDTGNKIAYYFDIPCNSTDESFCVDETNTTTPEVSASDCAYYVLDFSGLTAGQYITDQLQAEYGVSVRADSDKRAYTPGGAARVFDTSSPGAASHLGSPNEACTGGGPGVGAGGMPDSPYANCESLGNVLIIQESKNGAPNDSASGGTITFTFVQGSDVAELVLLGSSDTAATTVTVSASRKREGFYC
jgi:hypothetical protein